MSCSELAREEAAAKYLSGELDDAEAERFEEHFFSCEACFIELEELRALRSALERPESAAVEAGRPARISPFVLALGTAALVFLVGVLFFWLSGRSRVEPPVAFNRSELTRVEPPVYSAVRLAGPDTQAEQTFDKAMEKYASGDFEGALPGLRAARSLDPRTAKFSFYLGISALISNRTDEAIESLSRALAAGDPDFVADARFFLAKAHLRAGNPIAARFQLQKAIELEGQRSPEAKRLLALIDAGP